MDKIFVKKLFKLALHGVKESLILIGALVAILLFVGSILDYGTSKNIIWLFVSIGPITIAGRILWRYT